VIHADASAKYKPIRTGQQVGKPEARIPRILTVTVESKCVLLFDDACGYGWAVIVGRNRIAVVAAPCRRIGIECRHNHIACLASGFSEVADVLITKAEIERETFRDGKVVLDEAIDILVTPVTHVVSNDS